MGTQGIHLLPNPSRFSVNGVSFAVTSLDVLFHLRKEEFFQSGEEIEPINISSDGSNHLANLCQHLLQQRRCVGFWFHLKTNANQFIAFIQFSQ